MRFVPSINVLQLCNGHYLVLLHISRNEMSDIIISAQLPLVCDINELQDEVNSLCQHTWVNHVNTACYLGYWDVLPLRTLTKNLSQHPILQSFSLEENGDWHFLPVINTLPKLKKIIDGLQCNVAAVRLMRLKPATYIKPHRDKGLGMAYGQARLHLPIYTSKQVEFKVSQQIIPMKKGQLWYINADEIHSVKHFGDQDRIHLVIDCQVNDWLKQLIVEGQYRINDPLYC